MVSNGYILEKRVEIKEGASGTKVRDTSENPRGIKVIIEEGIEVKHHALSEAVSEGSEKNGRVEPDSVPSFRILQWWVPAATEVASGFVLVA